MSRYYPGLKERMAELKRQTTAVCPRCACTARRIDACFCTVYFKCRTCKAEFYINGMRGSHWKERKPMKKRYVEVPCEVEFRATATFCADGKGGMELVPDPEHWLRTRFPEGKPEGGRFVGYVFEAKHGKVLSPHPIAYGEWAVCQSAMQDGAVAFQPQPYATTALFELEEEPDGDA